MYLSVWTKVLTATDILRPVSVVQNKHILLTCLQTRCHLGDILKSNCWALRQLGFLVNLFYNKAHFKHFSNTLYKHFGKRHNSSQKAIELKSISYANKLNIQRLMRFHSHPLTMMEQRQHIVLVFYTTLSLLL